MEPKSGSSPMTSEDAEREILKRLMDTPPKPKQKKQGDANPKKRGRPLKTKTEGN